MFSTVKSLAILALVAVFASGVNWYDDTESFCGTDQSRPASCLVNTNPDKYKLRRAVARLPVNLCTGWLWGSEGHLITNNHCIQDQDKASKTIVEFDAECKSCDDPDNDIGRTCPGTVVANSTTLLATDVTLDFALVKLNLNPGVDLKQYGYLQARATPAKLNEDIFVIGHPALRPKRLSILSDDGKPARVTNTSTPSTCSETDVLGYNADTLGGSSGSPVLSAADNLVVALHNCGGCTPEDGQNTGNKIDKIIDYLNKLNLLPPNAVARPTSC